MYSGVVYRRYTQAQVVHHPTQPGLHHRPPPLMTDAADPGNGRRRAGRTPLGSGRLHSLGNLLFWVTLPRVVTVLRGRSPGKPSSSWSRTDVNWIASGSIEPYTGLTRMLAEGTRMLVILYARAKKTSRITTFVPLITFVRNPPANGLRITLCARMTTFPRSE